MIARRLSLTLMGLSLSIPCFPQVGPSLPSDAQVPMTSNQIAEARQADEYFKASKLLDALPLFEDLARKLPQKAVYAERLAACLFAKAGTLPLGPEKQSVVQRAGSELNRAQALGDHSDYLQIMIDRLNSAAKTPAKSSPVNLTAQEQMQSAEAAFGHGDLDAAIAGYQAAFLADPTLYEAPLFAGDVFFRKKDYDASGEWYARAVAVNPNRETAYRYWGDALLGAGQGNGARDKYFEAIIAEPYARAPWLALKNWAKKNSVTLSVPAVSVPNPTDPAQDSLASATARLKATLPNPDLIDLTRLAAANLIEPYLLLSAVNPGIARNYPSYRETHREQLRIYLNTFVIRAGQPSTTLP